MYRDGYAAGRADAQIGVDSAQVDDDPHWLRGYRAGQADHDLIRSLQRRTELRFSAWPRLGETD